jgi:membrane-associated HD superfamily phosphohydrolase
VKKAPLFNSTWHGWYWQFIAVTVVLFGAIQTVADIWFHYWITTSMPLAVLVVTYLVVPRTKERRLANAVAGVILMFLVDLVLEFSLPSQPVIQTWKSLLALNGYVLVFGLLMAYVFLRVTRYSERKRGEMEAKRSREQAPAKPTQPAVRRHRWKKKPKR